MHKTCPRRVLRKEVGSFFHLVLLRLNALRTSPRPCGTRINMLDTFIRHRGASLLSRRPAGTPTIRGKTKTTIFADINNHNSQCCCNLSCKLGSFFQAFACSAYMAPLPGFALSRERRRKRRRAELSREIGRFFRTLFTALPLSGSYENDRNYGRNGNVPGLRFWQSSLHTIGFVFSGVLFKYRPVSAQRSNLAKVVRTFARIA
jgi:hypothetical protein